MSDTVLPYKLDVGAKVTYGFDIYHGDDDNGPFQFGLALKSTPPRQFFWAKCTEGSHYVDPHYADHMLRAQVVNQDIAGNRNAANLSCLLYGAYHFMSSTVSAEEQINFFLKHANIQKGMLIPMLDVEPDEDGMPSAQLAYQCAQLIKNATGFWPIIYIDESNYLDLDGGIFHKTFPNDLHTICLAKYSNQPPKVHTQFQQYTEIGRLGAEGSNNYDLDVYFGSFNDLVANHTIK